MSKELDKQIAGQLVATAAVLRGLSLVLPTLHAPDCPSLHQGTCGCHLAPVIARMEETAASLTTRKRTRKPKP